MDPAPTAIRHAKLVTECFEEGPALESPAQDREPTTLLELELVKGSGSQGFREPTVDEKENDSRKGKVANVLFDEGSGVANTTYSSQGWLPGLDGRGGNPSGQGHQTSWFQDICKPDLVGGCTLPSLKELGFDKYVGKRNGNRPRNSVV